MFQCRPMPGCRQPHSCLHSTTTQHPGRKGTAQDSTRRPSVVAMSQGPTCSHRKGQTSNTCAESCGIRQRPMASMGRKEERHTNVLSRVLFPWDSARVFKVQWAAGHSAIPAQRSLVAVSDCQDRNALSVAAQPHVLCAEPEVMFLTWKAFNRCWISEGAALPPLQPLHTERWHRGVRGGHGCGKLVSNDQDCRHVRGLRACSGTEPLWGSDDRQGRGHLSLLASPLPCLNLVPIR